MRCSCSSSTHPRSSLPPAPEYSLLSALLAAGGLAGYCLVALRPAPLLASAEAGDPPARSRPGAVLQVRDGLTRRGAKAPIILLGVAVVASAALLLTITAGNTFFQDSWAFFFEREGNSPGDFLRPHNEHIVVIPVAIQKLLLALFGLSSELPEQLVLTAALMATGILVFVYVRRRVGDWPALIAAVIVLFLGPAWEVLLWPFEISLLGSVMAGVATLVVLDRNDRAGDIAACALLVISVGFSSLGVPFALAAAADVLARFRDRGFARLYVAAVPLAVYGVWYVTYGHDTAAGSHAATLKDPLGVPRFTAEGVAASLSSTLGLRTMAGGIHADAPTLFLLALAALVVICVAVALLERRDRGTIRRQLRRAGAAGIWPVLTATVVFWALTGLNSNGLRQPLESRYMYFGAILILFLAADLLTGMKVRPSGADSRGGRNRGDRRPQPRPPVRRRGISRRTDRLCAGRSRGDRNRAKLGPAGVLLRPLVLGDDLADQRQCRGLSGASRRRWFPRVWPG